MKSTLTLSILLVLASSIPTFGQDADQPQAEPNKNEIAVQGRGQPGQPQEYRYDAVPTHRADDVTRRLPDARRPIPDFDRRLPPPGPRMKTVIRYKTVYETVRKPVYDPYQGRTVYKEVQVAKTVPVEVQVPIDEPTGPYGPSMPDSPYDREPVFGPSLERIGLTLYQTNRGFQVTNVARGSIAGRMGIRSGDILTKVNGRSIYALSQLQNETRQSFSINFYRPRSRSTHWAEHKQSGWMPGGNGPEFGEWNEPEWSEPEWSQPRWGEWGPWRPVGNAPIGMNGPGMEGYPVGQPNLGG